jgi:hypothetical protein
MTAEYLRQVDQGFGHLKNITDKWDGNYYQNKEDDGH